MERVLYGEAAASGLLGAANGAYFGAYIVRTRSRARRVGASALALLNAGLALEGAAYVVTGPVPDGAAEGALALAARTALLAATLAVSLLIARQGRGRKR